VNGHQNNVQNFKKTAPTTVFKITERGCRLTSILNLKKRSTPTFSFAVNTENMSYLKKIFTEGTKTRNTKTDERQSSADDFKNANDKDAKSRSATIFREHREHS